jgi:hypothetical protein
MSDYDIHSCGYYCDRHACIVAQRNELRDKLFEGQAVKTYSGGKPNYTQPEARTGDCLLTKVCAAEGHAIQKQREWVGLTDMEIVGIATLNQGSDFSFARAIEAKLKEKNA